MTTGTSAEANTLDTRPDAAGVLLGELFDAHGRMIFGLCAVLLRDGHEAEDAAQQTFLSAYESLCAGVTPLRSEAWLAAIARNECLDRLRKRTREPVTQLDREPGVPGTEEAVVRNADFAVLRSALEELPTRQREALLLHELCGLSYLEIAQILGVSESAVESLLFRGRRRIHDRIGTLSVLPGVVVPLTLGEGLANAVPGFSAGRVVEAGAAQSTAAASAGGSAAGGTAAAGGGSSFTGLVAVKLASLPVVAKVAATAVLLVGTATVIADQGGFAGGNAVRAVADDPRPVDVVDTAAAAPLPVSEGGIPPVATTEVSADTAGETSGEGDADLPADGGQGASPAVSPLDEPSAGGAPARIGDTPDPGGSAGSGAKPTGEPVDGSSPPPVEPPVEEPVEEPGGVSEDPGSGSGNPGSPAGDSGGGVDAPPSGGGEPQTRGGNEASGPEGGSTGGGADDGGGSPAGGADTPTGGGETPAGGGEGGASGGESDEDDSGADDEGDDGEAHGHGKGKGHDKDNDEGWGDGKDNDWGPGHGDDEDEGPGNGNGNGHDKGRGRGHEQGEGHGHDGDG
jgi:RNA polymerase sigma factor (sigma-70 family)